MRRSKVRYHWDACTLIGASKLPLGSVFNAAYNQVTREANMENTLNYKELKASLKKNKQGCTLDYKSLRAEYTAMRKDSIIKGRKERAAKMLNKLNRG